MRISGAIVILFFSIHPLMCLNLFMLKLHIWWRTSFIACFYLHWPFQSPKQEGGKVCGFYVMKHMQDLVTTQFDVFPDVCILQLNLIQFSYNLDKINLICTHAVWFTDKKVYIDTTSCNNKTMVYIFLGQLLIYLQDM